jgi:hypothetical protein
MLKHHRLFGGAGAVVTAAAIALSGVMAASAAPGRLRAAVSGTEHFQAMSTSATAAPKVIASGVFTQAGVDHEGSHNTGTFVFLNGTITVKHSPGTGTQTVNPKTCLLQVNLHGTYKLLSGTGAYKGITGSGTYKLSILAIGAKSGGTCSKTKPPVAFQQLIQASGQVTL